MSSSISAIQKRFGHKLIGSRFMKRMIAKTLQHFPPKIIDFITKTIWFVGSFEDGWAFALRQEELKKGESLIFLSDELLAENENQIKYTIAHEIGHIILGHKNSILKIQSKAEIRKQEKKAHEFAKKFLKS